MHPGSNFLDISNDPEQEILKKNEPSFHVGVVISLLGSSIPCQLNRPRLVKQHHLSTTLTLAQVYGQS